MLPKMRKILARHGVVLLALVGILLFSKCPLYTFLGIPCPFCGLTRAHWAAICLDFPKAFAYHPLFFTVVPVVLYTAHRKRLKNTLPPKVEKGILCALIAAFILVYVLRLLQPSGFALIPLRPPH